MAYRVLIVDDEAGVRQALKQVLEYEGMQVRAASSGGEGITVFPEYRPHLSFLDVKMAGLDGLDTLTRLRELDPNATRHHDLRPRHARRRRSRPPSAAPSTSSRSRSTPTAC